MLVTLCEVLLASYSKCANSNVTSSCYNGKCQCVKNQEEKPHSDKIVHFPLAVKTNDALSLRGSFIRS